MRPTVLFGLSLVALVACGTTSKPSVESASPSTNTNKNAASRPITTAASTTPPLIAEVLHGPTKKDIVVGNCEQYLILVNDSQRIAGLGPFHYLYGPAGRAGITTGMALNPGRGVVLTRARTAHAPALVGLVPASDSVRPDPNPAAVAIVAHLSLAGACDHLTPSHGSVTGSEVPDLDQVPVRMDDTPELTWAGGQMHAYLDGDDRTISPYAYFGRLEGTASVAEHVHESSWEVLCAIEAAGTFTLAGVTKRLQDFDCVTVPPNTKHSWTPDPGTRLRAVQFYVPPGPEQRFQSLAAQAAAGTKPNTPSPK